MDCLQVTEHRKGLDEILTASGRNFDGNVGWVSCSGRRKLGTDWAFGTGQRNLVTERLRTWYRIMKFGYRQTQNLAQDNKIWVPTDSEFGTGQWNLGTDSAFGTGQRNLGTDRLSIWHRTTKFGYRLSIWHRTMKFGYRLSIWHRTRKFGYRQARHVAQDNEIWVPTENFAQDNEIWVPTEHLAQDNEIWVPTDSAFGTEQPKSQKQWSLKLI